MANKLLLNEYLQSLDIDIQKELIYNRVIAV